MKTIYKIALAFGLLCLQNNLKPMLRNCFKNIQVKKIDVHQQVTRKLYHSARSIPMRLPTKSRMLLMQSGIDLKKQWNSTAMLKSNQIDMNATGININLNTILKEKKDDLEKLILHEIRVDWLPGCRIYNNPERVAITKKVIDIIKSNKLDKIDVSNIIIPTTNNRIALISDSHGIELQRKKEITESQLEQLATIAEHINLSKKNLIFCENGKIMLKNIKLLDPFPYRLVVIGKGGGIYMVRKEHLVNADEIRRLYMLEGRRQLLDNDFEQKEVRDQYQNGGWRLRQFMDLEMATSQRGEFVDVSKTVIE